MSKSKQHAPEFKAKVALEALKGEETAAALASRFGVHPMMIHHCKHGLLEGASGVFERRAHRKPEIDAEQVKGFHAEIVVMPGSGSWRLPTLFWKGSSSRESGNLGAGSETQHDRARSPAAVDASRHLYLVAIMGWHTRRYWHGVSPTSWKPGFGSRR